MNKLVSLACLIVFVAQSTSAQQERMVFLVKPYLQYATQQSIRILWETSDKGTTTVEYDPARFRTGHAVLSLKRSITGLHTMHEVELFGLEPETNYLYRVCSIMPGGDTESAAPIRSWFTNTVRTTHHFCCLTINGYRLQFKAIDVSGQLFDYFDLHGSRKNKNTLPLTPSAPIFTSDRRIFPDTLFVAFAAALPDETIRYITDGKDPVDSSTLYKTPLLLHQPTKIKIASFNQYGRSRVNQATFTSQMPYTSTKITAPLPGLDYRYFAGMIRDEDPDKFKNVMYTAHGSVPRPDLDLLPHRRQHPKIIRLHPASARKLSPSPGDIRPYPRIFRSLPRIILLNKANNYFLYQAPKPPNTA